MRRPAIIFDFGNVIAHFDYVRAAERLAAPVGISGTELLEKARAVGFTELVKQYESGRMTSAEFATAVGDLVGLSWPLETFEAAWADIFWANDSIAPVVEQLKRAGYTLVLGSNTNDLHAAQFRRQFAGTLAHFDRLVLSYEVGHIKPSSGFYHACAAAAGMEPADCVFIDDLPENVEGARAAGLVGLLYVDTPTLLADLARLGVEVIDTSNPVDGS
jgi:putative hydrolase of the HAD superfamily